MNGRATQRLTGVLRQIDAPRRWLAALLIGGAIWGILQSPLAANPSPPAAGPPVEQTFSAALAGDGSLTGTLVFVEERGAPNYRIAALDLASGAQRAALAIPAEAVVYQIAPASDPDSVIVTYSAPPAAQANPGAAYDRSGIYRLSLLDGSLARILGDDQAGTYYAHPQLTADALYYDLHQPAAGVRRIERYDLRTRRVSLLADGATMPIAGAAGVAYFRLNPQTQARSLWLAASAGEHRELVAEGAFADLDTPVLAPDGRTLYFSAPAAAPEQSWLERAFGARAAGAHGNHARPASWQRLDLAAGGAPQPVAGEPRVALDAAFNGPTLGIV
ncbi:MAG TPA: hypothetical protein VD886_14630, partial [Herpetosiphonaceae bacterium]|nr:hypothetical protein [Herpetosiphonaceae bacterium]